MVWPSKVEAVLMLLITLAATGMTTARIRDSTVLGVSNEARNRQWTDDKLYYGID
jgi:hypothetical protein